MPSSERRINMKIPNAILTQTKGNALKVACKLYSLVNENRKSRNGYEICVKQSTLSKACGLSVSTVKRALSELAEKNIIVNRYRTTRENGHQSSYHYTMAFFNKFFYMRYDVFSYALTAQEFTLYAAMCKLRTNTINSFYQSLNDLSRILNADKSDICRTCSGLIEKGLIVKQLKRTKLGDYTDNTYFVVVRLRGTIKKKKPSRCRHKFTYIISLKSNYVNSCRRKSMHICSASFIGGSG